MTVYWVRFLDGRGRVYASEKLTCGSDAEAIARVRTIALKEQRSSFELWDGARLVPVHEAPQEIAC
jgi:hypothetical protein